MEKKSLGSEVRRRDKRKVCVFVGINEGELRIGKLVGRFEIIVRSLDFIF